MAVNRLHGIISLGLVDLAVTLAALALFLTAPGLGLAYLGITAVAGLTIVYAFCAKCPCKVTCGHVLPGLLAQRFHRQPGPYSRRDVGALLLALLAIVAFPQVWLWRYPALLIAFWVLSGIGVIQIRRFVCRACDHALCPLNRGYGAPPPAP